MYRLALIHTVEADYFFSKLSKWGVLIIFTNT